MRQRNSLCESQLLYLFLDVSSLARHRAFFEEALSMPVVENQFHLPHHHHGLVKYDAGGMILSLNVFGPGKFSGGRSDGLTVVCKLVPDGTSTPTRGPARLFTDWDGHHFVLPNATGAGRSPRVEVKELRLMVDDIRSAVRLYDGVLGLSLVDRTGTTARFATGTIDLVLEEGELAPDGLPIRRSTYLPVFYTADVTAMQAALEGRGLNFSQGAGFSDIGGTARFSDDSGNTFCLYQPSEESLGWDSGQKVQELVKDGRTTSKGAVPC